MDAVIGDLKMIDALADGKRSDGGRWWLFLGKFKRKAVRSTLGKRANCELKPPSLGSLCP